MIGRLLSSGLETRHIRALGVLILLLCAWLGARLHYSSPVKTTDSAQRFALQLDPNTATQAELAALPDIGPATARAIVEFRDAAKAKGNPRPFAKLSDLDQIPGIGPATLEGLEPYLTFAPG